MTIAEQVGQRLAERGEWQAGMRMHRRNDYDVRILHTTAGLPVWVRTPANSQFRPDPPWVPDLADWATLGVLIGVIWRSEDEFHLETCDTAIQASGCGNGSVSEHTGEAIGALYLAVKEAP